MFTENDEMDIMTWEAMRNQETLICFKILTDLDRIFYRDAVQIPSSQTAKLSS